MSVTLTRWGDTPFGTFGTLTVPGGWSCYTVERRWKNNAPNVSCIPAGTYRMVREMFHRGGYETYELVEVPNRTEILIHAANLSRELAGCIAPGVGLGMLKPKATQAEPATTPEWAVTSSRDALTRLLMELWKIPEPSLEVRWRLPVSG